MDSPEATAASRGWISRASGFEARRAWRLMRTLATGKPSAPVQQRRKRLRIPAGVKSLLRRVPSDVWTAAAGSGG